MVDKHARAKGKKVHSVKKEVSKRLQAYHWPGKLIELDNVIEHAVMPSQSGTIKLSNLPSAPQNLTL
ncbi:MAG: hypothetical protein ACLFUS_02260 [Candidatus Sumerlaeia bacterium]